MDHKKICFIMCINNRNYAEESVRYLSELEIPQGYTTEIIQIEEADFMTQGYEAGRTASTAKYKVYLHQDVFLVNSKVIIEMLKIFEDSSIGMIGVVGVKQLPECAVPWYGTRYGKIYACDGMQTRIAEFQEVKDEYEEVEAIDGLLMITQYEIPWRADVIKGWDFYDVSQSQEYRNAGYRVVVPRMEMPWCIHDDGIINLKNYYENRRVYLSEYKK